MSLKRQAITSSIWIFIETVIVRGVTFFTMLYLARKLGPKEFGLFGMMAIFIAFGNVLVNSGMGASLVRKDNAVEDDYATVFYTNILFSLFLYLIIYFSAPFISDFYGFEELIQLIRVYGIVFIVTGFNVVQMAIHTKNLDFRRLALYNIPGIIIGAVVGIILAINGYGIWSVIYMQLIISVLNSLFIWGFSKWKPRFQFSKEKMKEHLGFGYKLSLSEILNVLFENSYFLVIGKFFPIKEVGYYERSKSLTNYPVTILTGVVSKVTFPLLVKVKGNSELVEQTYRKVMALLFSIVTPIMLSAFVLAGPLIRFFLGDQWIMMTPYFKILCLAALLHPLHVLNLNVLQVYGRSDLFLKMEVLKKIILVVLLAIGFHFGVIGIVMSILCTSIISFFINAHYNQPFLKFGSLKQIKMTIKPLLIGVVMALSMHVASIVIPNSGLINGLIIPALLGLGIYIMGHLLFKTETSKFIIQLLKEQL